jgi:hypothetical protein
MTDERHEKISRRAYELWEKEGGAHGRHDDHWHQAASEHNSEGGSATTALPEEPADSPATPTPMTEAPAAPLDPEPADHPAQTTAAEPLAPANAQPAAKATKPRRGKATTKPA